MKALVLEIEALLWCFALRPAEDELCVIVACGGRRSDAEEVWDDAIADDGTDTATHNFLSPEGVGGFVMEGDLVVKDDRQWIDGTWRRATDSEVLAWLRWAEASGG